MHIGTTNLDFVTVCFIKVGFFWVLKHWWSNTKAKCYGSNEIDNYSEVNQRVCCAILF
jgi:hypothetical protein